MINELSAATALTVINDELSEELRAVRRIVTAQTAIVQTAIGERRTATAQTAIGERRTADSNRALTVIVRQHENCVKLSTGTVRCTK